ncbi:MAG: radical SAM protein [Myxococcales bacterium]|nr:radical SAM protein [Myxococcales bacterium]
MRVSLIYPPTGDLRAPQLALPSLAAYLRGQGAQVDLLDLNVEGVYFLAQEQQLSRTCERLVDKTRAGLDPRFLLLADAARERAGWALGALRDSEVFFNPHDHRAARDVFNGMLVASGAASERRVSFGLDPIRYEVQGVDTGRVRDLIEVSDSDDANVFARFYKHVVIPRLVDDRPDLIGITITNRQQLIPGLTLARRLRDQGLFVVLGGALMSKFAEQLPRLPEFFRYFADGVVCNEGETATAALLDQLAGSRDFSRVPNLLFVADGRVRRNAVYVEDVNGLRTPDFAGLPLDKYLVPEPVLPILTGKGCYFNRCKFCDIPFINRVAAKAYRVRAPEKVVEDVRQLEARHGARSFVITDEALAPKLMLRLADAFAPYRHEPRYFSGYARLEEGYTPAVFRRLHAMGVRKLFFGLESASQRTIDHMNKGTRSDSAGPILRACRSAGIGFHVFSIIGFPEEDEAHARQTMQFFADHRGTLDHARNSFDIHAFGLEHRAEYFRQRSMYGIRVKASALRRDLPIGLEAEEWTNPRGLGKDDVERLIEGEFRPELGRLFRRFHAGCNPIWPGTEEYSILYAARFEHRADFPFATALPSIDSSVKLSVRWSPAALIERRNQWVVVQFGGRQIEFASALFETLATTGQMTCREYLTQIAGEGARDEQGLRERADRIHDMLALGLLQLTTESLPQPPAGQTLPMFRKKQLLRALCVREAAELGIEPTEHEQRQFVADFRRQYGLSDPGSQESWLAAQGLSEGEFCAIMRELLLVDMVEAVHDAGLREGMIEYMKVASALDRGQPSAWNATQVKGPVHGAPTVGGGGGPSARAGEAQERPAWH